MNRTLVSSLRPIALAAGCVALAAAVHAADAKSSSKTAPAERAKSAEGWISAAPGKANASGIRLRYQVSPALLPGQMGIVKLQFSGVTRDDAKVEWRAPAGSSWRGPEGITGSSMLLPPGQVTTIALEITPAADGMAYLDVFTSQGGRASAQSVPLKVGSGAIQLKREGTLQTTPGGEKVISLPSTPK
jgi:hypothetical protein